MRKSNKFIILAGTMLLCTSCGSTNAGMAELVTSEPALTEEVVVTDSGYEEEEVTYDFQGELDSYTEEDFDNAIDKTNEVCVNGSDFDEAELFLIAKIDGINLYMSTSSNCLILTEGDKRYIYDIPCTSPLGVLPRFLYQDFDGDGTQEIAVSSHIGTGTGVSVDFFYMLDRNQEGIFESKEFTSDEYIEQMNEHFSFTYDEEKQEVQYYLDGEPVGEAFSLFCEYSEEDKGDSAFTGVDMGDFVDFVYEDEKIVLTAALEGRIESWCGSPFFQNADLIAEVGYSEDGTFTVENVELQFE